MNVQNQPDYLQTLILILDRGQKSNSYKFALLRALGDVVESNQETDSISQEWLAKRFLKYYWPLTVQFRIRQATDPTRDPVIMRFIRDEVAELKLSSRVSVHDYEGRYPSNHKKLIAMCCNRGGCFDEVIPRFHNLRGGATVPAVMYTHVGNVLNLRSGVRAFLQGYYRTVQLLAVGGWVQFTEQFTFAPKLYEKISGITPDRKHERYRDFLLEFQGSKCFYCGLGAEKSLHVDHAIPWSFVLEDRVWNLVLACEACNCSKSDRTPDDSSLTKLNERNSRLLDRARVAHSVPLATAIKRDLEIFTTESLESHVALLVRNCRDEGFGVWRLA
jgi:hypothetical protein